MQNDKKHHKMAFIFKLKNQRGNPGYLKQHVSGNMTINTTRKNPLFLSPYRFCCQTRRPWHLHLLSIPICPKRSYLHTCILYMYTYHIDGSWWLYISAMYDTLRSSLNVYQYVHMRILRFYRIVHVSSKTIHWLHLFMHM